MLSKETKKKIDDARDILVGQLPLPSDQVELITIALIYKFMDDQDEDLRQLGFPEAFFSDDLKPYSWQRLMTNEIDAEARVTTFIKGIEEIQKADHIPQLFRDIFKNTFLKFRDGRTLHLFLGVINGFSYDHSEELGNAFEYLLKSMGAQGENGQFRTPRNIIDFIVEVVDPDKSHSILDPACGTGGFLLSAYKHILRKYTTGMEHYRITLNNEDVEGIPVEWGDKLTSLDLQQLGTSIEGYDITPLMARLAKVNLFLHQFKSPRIHEYDTLTSDGRWKDKYDCILANPPFMTPKGGVSTHSKFRIRASKAEVLFSDYILEHLTPDGMAGFIVPEGIIFQNSGDYVVLRKWLVEATGLWAVVSLPSHVFQPYSGVKTSILFIDRKIARGRDEIILLKVENDGYSLNTNRAPIANNDLPEALNVLTIGKKSLVELQEYLEQNCGKHNMPKVLIKPRKEFARLDSYKAQTSAFNLIRKQHEKCQALEKEIKELPIPKGEGEKKRARLQTAFNKQTAEFFKVAGVKYEKLSAPLQTYFDASLKEDVIAYGADNSKVGNLETRLREYLDGERDYTLSFDKYVGESAIVDLLDHELVELGELVEILDSRRKPITKIDRESGPYPYYGATGVLDHVIDYIFDEPLVLVGEDGAKWVAGEKTAYAVSGRTWVNNHAHVLRPIRVRLLDTYLIELLNYMDLSSFINGVTVPKLNQEKLRSIQIPLPPLEIQKEIVAEIEVYQKVIDGCNLIISNYKATFRIDSDWPVVELGEVCRFSSGGTPSKANASYWLGEIPWVSAKDLKTERIYDAAMHVSEAAIAETATQIAPVGSVLILVRGMGLANGVPICEVMKPCAFNQDLKAMHPKSAVISATFLAFALRQQAAQFNRILETAAHGTLKINSDDLRQIQIAIPPLEIQQKIVAELEEDMAAVTGAKRLKAKMEANIRATIGRLWGKD